MKLVDDINKIASQSAERTEMIGKIAVKAKEMHDQIMLIISNHMYENTEKNSKELGAYLECATALGTCVSHFFEVSEAVLIESMQAVQEGKESSEDVLTFILMLGSCLKTIDTNIERSTPHLRKVCEDARTKFPTTGELYQATTKGTKITDVERLEDE